MGDHWHRKMIEGKAGLMAALTTVCISIGGLVEILPMFTVGNGHTAELPEPYTPLQIAGRDIYQREGCMACHSQMVRPFRDETLRYGEWSHAAEYTWDRPFLLGSRRIGPDLHRVGGKYPDSWHYRHMRDPRSVVKGSIMPPYPWLLEWKIDPDDVAASLRALHRLGTPYTEEQLENTAAVLKAEAEPIVASMRKDPEIDVEWDDEIVALTAYLQRLGTDRPGKVAKAGE